MDAGLNAIFSFGVRGVAGLASGKAMMEGLGKAAAETTHTLRSQAFATGFFVRAADNLFRSLGSLTDQYGKFEQIVAMSKGLLGETSPEVQRLVDTARTFRGTEHGPHALAQAILDLNYAGVQGNDTYAALKTTLDLATVSGWKMSEAAIAVANVQGAWGGTLTSTDDLMIKFVNAAQASTFQIGNLMRAMTLAQGASKIYGQSLGETLTGLGLLAPITGANTKAGSSWAAALRSIGNAKKQLKLKQLGVDLKDSMGEFRPALDIFADFIDKTQKLDTLQRAAKTQDIFGERGSRVIAATMRVMEKGIKDANGQFVTGRAAIDVWREKIEKGRGSLEDMARLARENLPMAWQMMKNMITNTLITLGAKLKDHVMFFIDRISSIAGGLQHIFSGWVGSLAAVAIHLGIVVGSLSLAAKLAGVLGMSRLAASIAPGALAAGGAAGGLLGGMAAPGMAIAGSTAAAQSKLRGYGGWQFSQAPQRFATSDMVRYASKTAPSGWAVRMPVATGTMTGIGAAGLGARAAAVGLGALGSVASALLSPISLLAFAFWGLTEVSDRMRQSEEEKLKKKMELEGTVSGFGTVGQGLIQAFRAGKLGAESPILKEFNQNPRLAEIFTNMAVSINSMFSARDAGLIPKNLSNEAVFQRGFMVGGQRLMGELDKMPVTPEMRESLKATLRSAIIDFAPQLEKVGGIKGPIGFDEGSKENKLLAISTEEHKRRLVAAAGVANPIDAALEWQKAAQAMRIAGETLGNLGEKVQVLVYVDGFKAEVMRATNTNPKRVILGPEDNAGDSLFGG